MTPAGVNGGPHHVQRNTAPARRHSPRLLVVEEAGNNLYAPLWRSGQAVTSRFPRTHPTHARMDAVNSPHRRGSYVSIHPPVSVNIASMPLPSTSTNCKWTGE
jgi:hypothetical protein